LRLNLLEAWSGDNISDIYTNFEANVDTVDYEITCGYKEFQRTLSTSIEHNTIQQKSKLELMIHLCDLLPKRSTTFPYLCNQTSLDAIIQSSQPNIKHSIHYINYDTTHMIQLFHQGLNHCVIWN